MSFVQDARPLFWAVHLGGNALPAAEACGRPVMIQTYPAELAAIAHASGAGLEVSAKGFGVPGASDNRLDTTDPEQALALKTAGADLVACAVGSEHGHASRLDLQRLGRIAERVQGPLVLHSGSGIDAGDLRAAVRLGVVKVNVGSSLCRAPWVSGPGAISHLAVYASVREGCAKPPPPT